MPNAERTRLATRPSFTARISGMPPATAASNPSMTRLRRASSNSSVPWWASRALLAVTTCLPACRARRMKVRAGSSPPISSITTCTEGSSMAWAASVVSGKRERSIPSRDRVRSASATRPSASAQPARSASSAPWLWRIRATPHPTVPSPRRAILISFIRSFRRPRRVWSAPRRVGPLPAAGEGLEAAQGLADALRVLHEGEPDVAVAVLAEADARRHRHLALLDQELGELERAHAAEGLRDGGPHEHGPPGLRHRPADLVEAVDEDVAALAVQLHDVSHALLLALQRDDGRDLDGLEGAVVEVRLDAGQGVDHLAVAAHEAHPPAGHVVGLGQREDLDPHVLGPRDLEEGRRPEAVVGEVGVGEVVHHHQLVLAREVDHLHEELAVHAEGGGVVREGQDQ